MKIGILWCVLFINSTLLTFGQEDNNTANDYFKIESATMENQISGANSESNSRIIYDINLQSMRRFNLKDIRGKINGKNLQGKIIYNNAISDSMIIENGNNFIIRFAKYNNEAKVENNDDSQIPPRKKCYGNKKNNGDNALIFLSFYIENMQYNFRIKCSKKIISKERQLPQ